ncbi:hypothetical protein [Helicobacter trogontum]|nr:hypothetical protein [Helicobacter trogontum]
MKKSDYFILIFIFCLAFAYLAYELYMIYSIQTALQNLTLILHKKGLIL